MSPAQHGNFQLGEQSADSLVGLHHEHFDQGVGKGIILRYRIDDTTVVGKDQINIRKIQMKLRPTHRYFINLDYFPT